MNHWAKAGVLDRLFEELQHQQLVRIRIEAVSLDSTIVKVHPDGNAGSSPLCTRFEPWRYGKAWYKRRNEIERLFRRLRGFRRIFSRFDRLDVGRRESARQAFAVGLVASHTDGSARQTDRFSFDIMGAPAVDCGAMPVCSGTLRRLEH